MASGLWAPLSRTSLECADAISSSRKNGLQYGCSTPGGTTEREFAATTEPGRDSKLPLKKRHWAPSGSAGEQGTN